MKVAMVSEHASPLAALGGADAGGQNVHVGALAAELVRQGHAVVVHTRRDDPDLPAQVRTSAGVTVHHVDAGPPEVIPKDELRPFMDRFAEVLHRRWLEDPPDVVHAHFWMSGLASLAAAASLGVGVVQTFHALGTVKRRHQGADDTSPPDRLVTEARIATQVDRILATCEDEVCELEAMGASRRRIRVAPCGVDLRLFRPDGPAVPRHRARRLLALGRLVPRKGVADAIEALRWLRGVELVVAGGPPRAELGRDPEVARLRRIAERSGVASRVRFLGQLTRTAVPSVIRSADAVVSVPYYEPFGITPLEAMACGVPPVVSAVGGLAESVVDGETGLHVPPGSPRAVARAVAHLLADPGLRARLGAAGVARVRERYSWPGIAATTAAVYREVVASRAVVPHAVGVGS